VKLSMPSGRRICNLVKFYDILKLEYRRVFLLITLYTGRFIMYSGITKIYYRKIVGQVFTTPVQIEGTTQNVSPLSCFSS